MARCCETSPGRPAPSSQGRIMSIRRYFLSALAAAFMLAQSVAAQTELPEDMEVVSSLWCDTPAQIETVLRAHYVDKVPLASAMADINRFDPDACVRARVIVKMGNEVKRFIAGEALISVSEAKVHGVMRGAVPMMARQVQTWYSAKVLAELKEI
jgi:hypothetical protein